MSALPQDMEAAKLSNWFYPGDLLKDKSHQFIEQSHATVGIFVNKNFEQATNVLVVLKHSKDVFLLKYAANLIAFNQASICISEISDEIAKNRFSEEKVREFLNVHPQTMFTKIPNLSQELLAKQNFALGQSMFRS